MEHWSLQNSHFYLNQWIKKTRIPVLRCRMRISKVRRKGDIAPPAPWPTVRLGSVGEEPGLERWWDARAPPAVPGGGATPRWGAHARWEPRPGRGTPRWGATPGGGAPRPVGYAGGVRPGGGPRDKWTSSFNRLYPPLSPRSSDMLCVFWYNIPLIYVFRCEINFKK